MSRIVKVLLTLAMCWPASNVTAQPASPTKSKGVPCYTPAATAPGTADAPQAPKLIELAVQQDFKQTEQTGEILRRNGPPARTLPGFSAIDSSLMSIEHVDALFSTSISVFSTLRRDDLLPRDIGLEILPGLPMSSENPATTCEEFQRLYYPSAAKSLWHNLAFSLAISQNVGTTEAAGSLSDLVIGARTMIVAGQASPKLKGYMQKHEELSALIGATPAGDQEQSKLVDAYILRDRLRQSIGEAEKNRVGWLWEVGTAMVLEVPEHRLSSRSIVRDAVWLNPIYRFDRKPIDLAGLIRYIYEPLIDDHVADLGGRFGIKYQGIYFSIEGSGRWRSQKLAPDDDRDSGRVVGAVGYGLNRSTQINLTFGKNYSLDFTNSGSFLASFGLTLGLGSVPLGVSQ